jgi:hypothetical protein
MGFQTVSDDVNEKAFPWFVYLYKLEKNFKMFQNLLLIYKVSSSIEQ